MDLEFYVDCSTSSCLAPSNSVFSPTEQMTLPSPGPLSDSFLSPGSVLFDEHSGRESTLFSAASRTSLSQFPELAERYEKVMCGDLEQSLTAKAKIIRVFTSSTFTGTYRT